MTRYDSLLWLSVLSVFFAPGRTCCCVIVLSFMYKRRQAPLEACCGRGNIAVARFFSPSFVSNCSGLGAFFIRGTYSFMVATLFCIRTMSFRSLICLVYGC